MEPQLLTTMGAWTTMRTRLLSGWPLLLLLLQDACTPTARLDRPLLPSTCCSAHNTHQPPTHVRSVGQVPISWLASQHAILLGKSNMK
jgi:hypothetical protein